MQRAPARAWRPRWRRRGRRGRGRAGRPRRRTATDRRAGDLVLAGRAARSGSPPPLSIARERMRQRRRRPGRDPRSVATRTSWSARPPRSPPRRPSWRAEAGRSAAEALERRGHPPDARPSSPTEREENRLAALVRAAADRREGLARLTGQVNSLRSRAEAAEAEIGRLTGAAQRGRASGPSRPAGRSPSLETTGRRPGRRRARPGLRPRGGAGGQGGSIEAELGALRTEERVADPGAGGAGGPGRGAAGRTQPQGRAPRRCWRPPTGSTACSGRWPRWSPCEPAYETAVAAAFGAAADAVAVTGRRCGAGRGRASQGRGPGPGRSAARRARRRGRRTDDRRLAERCPTGAVLRGRRGRGTGRARRRRCTGCCARSRSSTTWPPPGRLVDRLPDLIGRHHATATCSAPTSRPAARSAQPSLIEVQAAVDDAEQRLTEATTAASGSGSPRPSSRSGSG